MTRACRYVPLILFVFCGLWVACTQTRNPCLVPKIATFNIETVHLVKPADTSFTDTALPAAVFIPLAKVDSNVGTIFPLQSIFTISLSPDTNFCRWAFTTDSFRNEFDTLSFYYQRDLQFISNACGFTYFYTLDSVHTTHNNIDSLFITNTSVTNNVNTKHLRIYIKPQL
jgi:hypothetical protein